VNGFAADDRQQFKPGLAHALDGQIGNSGLLLKSKQVAFGDS
jgi:hypothetical protein